MHIKLIIYKIILISFNKIKETSINKMNIFYIKKIELKIIKVDRINWWKLQFLKIIDSLNIKNNKAKFIDITNNKNNLKNLGYSIHYMNSNRTNNTYKINSSINSNFIRNFQTKKAANNKTHLTNNIWIDFLIRAVTASVNPIFSRLFLIWIIIKTFKIFSSSTANKIY